MALRFRLIGVPVEIHPAFFFIGLILARPRGVEWEELLRVAIWVAVVTFSILVHELGHALVMRACGCAARIELYMLGGLTHWEDGASPSPRQRILVSIGGPAAGFVIGGIVATVTHFLPPPSGPWTLLAHYLVWVNVAWGALNLIPMLPFDGGNIMAAALASLTGGRGKTAARGISIAVAVAVFVAAALYGWLWVVVLSAWAGISNVSGLRERWATGRDAPLWKQLDEAWKLRSSGEVEAAMEQVEAVLFAARSGALRSEAAQQLAWALLDLDKAEEAQQQLNVCPAAYPPAPGLLGAIALARGGAKEAAVFMERALADEVNVATVHYALRVYLELGRLDEVVELLGSESAWEVTPRLNATRAATALFEAERYGDARELFRRSFERDGDAEDAYNLACCQVRVGEIEDAASWLQAAAAAGLADVALLDDDHDIDPLRELASFVAIRERVAAADEAARRDGATSDE